MKKKNKKRKLKIIIFIIILLILIVLSLTIYFANKNVIITLKGNKKETIEVFTEYKDPGYNATIFNYNINKYIKTKSDLNTEKIGTYTITYEFSFLDIHKIKREITVIDTTKPTIKLNGAEKITMYVDGDYKEESVTVEDNYDKDLSNNITINSNLDIHTKGTYKITYTVKDSSNNENSVSRTVQVNSKPTNKKICNSSNPIHKYICENNYKISIAYYNLDNNKSYYYNKDAVYYGASLIKTVDALYLYDKKLINDKLKPYVKKAITVSDNPSHKYLVNYIGVNNLRNYGKSLGSNYTLVGGDKFGNTTVNDQVIYMKRLYEITKDGQNEELKSFFLNTRRNSLILPNGPHVMHKYGFWDQVSHDSGIVLDEHPYILVVLTKEAKKDSSKIINNISKLVYDYHKEQTY